MSGGVRGSRLQLDPASSRVSGAPSRAPVFDLRVDRLFASLPGDLDAVSAVGQVRPLAFVDDDPDRPRALLFPHPLERALCNRPTLRAEVRNEDATWGSTSLRDPIVLRPSAASSRSSRSSSRSARRSDTSSGIASSGAVPSALVSASTAACKVSASSLQTWLQGVVYSLGHGARFVSFRPTKQGLWPLRGLNPDTLSGCGF